MVNFCPLGGTWKFRFIGLTDSRDVFFQPNLDDSLWEDVQIPHDWSVGMGYDRQQGDAATAYLIGGVGWYRKRLLGLKKTPKGRTFIDFDGIYNNCSIWVNGKFVGSHYNGYVPFCLDVTDYLGDTDVDLLAIKVDHSQYVDTRWYSGSGIFREVSYRSVGQYYFEPFSLKVKATVNDLGADLGISSYCAVSTGVESAEGLSVLVYIYDAQGKQVGGAKSLFQFGCSKRIKLESQLHLSGFTPWDVNGAYLYTARLTLMNGEQILDVIETPFGIREMRYDRNAGFFLNKRRMVIKGVCLHHDCGCVGAAVPPDVWERRLRKLKEGGCNAVRTAHNPVSQSLLDLCDRLGLLVQEEFFDEWEFPKDKRLNQAERHDDWLSRGYSRKFRECSKEDIINTINHHYNHPSIFQWSIGNEIEWTYESSVAATGFFDTRWDGNYFWSLPPKTMEEIRHYLRVHNAEGLSIGETAKMLSRIVKDHDDTRPVIANCILPSASFESGFADALDIVGFSYRRVMYDYARQNYPDKICMGTENLAQWHEWKAVEERPWISGLFLWTGIDYLGEAHSTGWPVKSLDTGLLDIAGFEKPSWHFFRSLWVESPVIYLATQAEGNAEVKSSVGWETRLWKWHAVNSHWNYEKDETIIVECYTNCEEAVLFLNGKSLGSQVVCESDDRIARWKVSYTPGTITVVGYTNRIRTAEYSVSTAAEVEFLQMRADRTRMAVNTGQCIHVEMQLCDSSGTPISHKERELTFIVEGPLVMLGCDNGALDNVGQHAIPRVETHRGKALLILREHGVKGVAVIRALTENGRIEGILEVLVD